MPKYLIKRSTLQSIANAIRVKAGLTEELDPANFGALILEIPTATQGLEFKLVEEENSSALSYYCTGRGTATDADIVIPDRVDNYSVTHIDTSAFSEDLFITSLTAHLPYVGKYAFWKCTNLKRVNLSDLMSISEYAFEACSSLTDVYIEFQESSSGRLREACFMDCASLTNISFVNLGSIEFGAFRRCTSLASITLPVTLNYIGTGAFSGCETLGTIYYEGTVEQWEAIDKISGWRGNAPIAVVQCSDGQASVIEPDKIIQFFIGGELYEAYDGMTWEQWVHSDFNTNYYSVTGSRIYTDQQGQHYVSLDGTVDGLVSPSDLIIATHAYKKVGVGFD